MPVLLSPCVEQKSKMSHSVSLSARCIIPTKWSATKIKWNVPFWATQFHWSLSVAIVLYWLVWYGLYERDKNETNGKQYTRFRLYIWNTMHRHTNTHANTLSKRVNNEPSFSVDKQHSPLCISLLIIYLLSISCFYYFLFRPAFRQHFRCKEFAVAITFFT